MAILIGFVGTILRGGMLVGEGVIAVGTYSMLVFLTQRLYGAYSSRGPHLICISEQWPRRSGLWIY